MRTINEIIRDARSDGLIVVKLNILLGLDISFNSSFLLLSND